MDKWPGAWSFWSLHPACAQNKTLISNIVILNNNDQCYGVFYYGELFV